MHENWRKLPWARQLVLFCRNTAIGIVLLPSLPAPVDAVEVDGSARFETDYRFRGLSLSNRQPAVSANLAASLANGLFAGIEGVSTAYPRIDRPATQRGGEIDISAGWSRNLGLLTASAGAIGYFYPGAGGGEFGEGFASLTGGLGPATLTLGANYAPEQGTISDSLYLRALAAVAIPATPLTIKASVGRETGAFDAGRTKIDYMAGAEYRFRVLTVGLRYVGNDVPGSAPRPFGRTGGNAVVGSVAVNF